MTMTLHSKLTCTPFKILLDSQLTLDDIKVALDKSAIVPSKMGQLVPNK